MLALIGARSRRSPSSDAAPSDGCHKLLGGGNAALKGQRRQDFVVVGFTGRANSANEVGALLLGYYDDEGKLRSAGSVGTGWSTTQGTELHEQLVRLEWKTPAMHPDDVKPGRWSRCARGTERWVRPKMIVEVAFGEWTPDGSIWHATFRGVRMDKAARSIRREQPGAPPAAAKAAGNLRTTVKISNPDRVVSQNPSTRHTLSCCVAD